MSRTLFPTSTITERFSLEGFLILKVLVILSGIYNAPQRKGQLRSTHKRSRKTTGIRILVYPTPPPPGFLHLLSFQIQFLMSASAPAQLLPHRVCTSTSPYLMSFRGWIMGTAGYVVEDGLYAPVVDARVWRDMFGILRG
ncbi:hypothetical protein QC762_214245 [Podospora pseudocomata]|uniref:Uncharacterized protein n=1 Tax=Podospora pseudocomata TaxID=2093779 RepID=A0ABR0GP99_9PEZI|nr:hypothetical protein QC762_214245 [Podospora pseudocomata]